MLNEVLMEGFVSGRSWTHSNDQFFRLATYRDRQRAQKRKDGRDEPDYVTVRLPNTGLPVNLQPGTKVRVHGYIQSRYYDETLGEWLENAKGPIESLSVGKDHRRDVRHNRVVTEIVCERLVPLMIPDVKPEADGAEAQGQQQAKNGGKQAQQAAKNGKKKAPAPAASAPAKEPDMTPDIAEDQPA